MFSRPSWGDAGADAIATAEQQIAVLQDQIAALRDLSTSLAIETRNVLQP